MVKILSLLFFISVLVFVFINDARFFASEEDEEPYQLEKGHVEWRNRPLKLQVEIADNRIERAVGLMYRKELASDRGMVFLYQQEQPLKVWMKDMLFAIDVIFLSANGEIVSLLQNLPPCRRKPCEIFASTADAQYILEVNAGFIDKNAVKLGDVLLFFF